MKHPVYTRDEQRKIITRVLTPRQVAVSYDITMRALREQRYRKEGIPFVTYNDRPFYLESEVRDRLKTRSPP